MRKLRSDIVVLLASEFAGKDPRRGFSFDEIINFFKKYDSSIGKENYNGIRPTRRDLFETCLSSLPPLQQFIAVLDLLNNPPPSKYPMPTKDKIKEIKKRIFSILNLTPITDEIACLNLERRFADLITDWYRITSRIHESPASSITASRTMIENLYIAILKNSNIPINEIDKIKGDLGKLHKAVCKVLELDNWEKKIIAGLSSLIYGVAEMSNIAGDRHAGDFKSVTFEMAEFIANITGSISVFIYKVFLTRKISGAIRGKECIEDVGVQTHGDKQGL